MIGTNHLQKRFQVFISSTFKDLQVERSKLREALNQNNYIAEGMEFFPAANKKQWEIIKERIDYSDLYVLIIGDRYGSIANNAAQLEPEIIKKRKLDEGSEIISYTHLEFLYAKSKGNIPILVFLKADKKTNKKNNEIKEIEEIEKKNLKEFIKETQFGSNLTTTTWSDKTELIQKVLAALRDAESDDEFAVKNGWIKANFLNKPINLGDKSVLLESKLHYIKFVSYTNKLKHKKPLYKKYIIRLKKEVDVWDEYVTLTINHLSHYVNKFQYYARTDGDAIDFSCFLPFVNKLTFSDINAGAKDTILNPTIETPSNVFVNSCSFYNGFQDGNMDLAVKATQFTKQLRLLVDFTSIPNFKNLFKLLQCVQIHKDQTEEDITASYISIQDGIYMIEKHNIEEGIVLKFKFDLYHD